MPLEEHDNARRFLEGFGHGLPDEFDQRFGRQDFLYAATDFGGNADAFAAVLIDGERRDATFAHHIDFTLDDLLDVLRVQVVATHDQHVFQTAGDVQLAVALEARSPVRSQVWPSCWTKVLAVASGLRQ